MATFVTLAQRQTLARMAAQAFDYASNAATGRDQFAAMACAEHAHNVAAHMHLACTASTARGADTHIEKARAELGYCAIQANDAT